MATSASGKGRWLGMGEWGDDDLITDVERPTPAAALVVNDWWWTGPPTPTLIPWTWLTTPLELRQDKPINYAAITGTSNVVAVATNSTSQTTYGTFSATGTIYTDLVRDAANLAAFLVTYYSSPLLRVPTWTIDLVPRIASGNAEEVWRVLGRGIGDRVTLGPVTLTDSGGTTVTLPVPSQLPAAAQSIVIEGIAQVSSPTIRTVTWTSSPLLGTTPGTPGPWFQLDYSALDGTDLAPF